jgi:hypothetical protein
VSFAPGLHELGLWSVPPSVDTVYVAGGAYVRGGLEVSARDRFSVRGRGVISGESFVWRALKSNLQHSATDCWQDCVKLIELLGGEGHVIEGVTLANSPYYNVAANWPVRELTAVGVKIVGSWPYNTDGFDVPPDSSVSYSFVSTNDDSFKISSSGGMVRRCTVWQRRVGSVFQMGWWNKTASGVRVSEIDVVRADWPFDGSELAGVFVFRDGNADAGVLSDYVFRDVRVDTPVYRALWIVTNGGQGISGFVVEDLAVASFAGGGQVNLLQGTSAGPITDFVFRDFTVGGVEVNAGNAGGLGQIQIGSDVSGVVFE